MDHPCNGRAPPREYHAGLARENGQISHRRCYYRILGRTHSNLLAAEVKVGDHFGRHHVFLMFNGAPVEAFPRPFTRWQLLTPGAGDANGRHSHVRAVGERGGHPIPHDERQGLLQDLAFLHELGMVNHEEEYAAFEYIAQYQLPSPRPMAEGAIVHRREGQHH